MRWVKDQPQASFPTKQQLMLQEVCMSVCGAHKRRVRVPGMDACVHGDYLIQKGDCLCKLWASDRVPWEWAKTSLIQASKPQQKQQLHCRWQCSCCPYGQQPQTHTSMHPPILHPFNQIRHSSRDLATSSGEFKPSWNVWLTACMNEPLIELESGVTWYAPQKR